MLFNDAYGFINWPLTVLLLLIEVLLVMKPVLISARMTFTAAYCCIRISNSWEDAYPYSGWTGYSPSLAGLPFSNAYRFID